MAALITKWCLVAWLTLGALATISIVGKPRKPLTSGTAAFIVAVCAIEIVLILAFWGAS